MPVVTDFGARCLLTDRAKRVSNTGGMDEPTHEHESRFWDEVAAWLLGARSIDVRGWSADEIEAFLRAMQEGQEPH